MGQLGFVIDHSRCIGCHACTVACKSENDVPLGDFRTWVKYTEEGSFPAVKRSFAVLRCNQCTDAPCMEICPTGALNKLGNGIVDLDPQACIGCKSCLQACPYDALYINDATGTAEKCHFCAHRTEMGLAPACAVVCPTEAIIPGDFHDPESRVSKLKAAGDLTVRKPEAGTKPNVYYREVTAAGIEPLNTNAFGGYLWANRHPSANLAVEAFDRQNESELSKPQARTTYDVDHAPMWGEKVSGYLFTKSISAGVFLAALLLMVRTGRYELNGFLATAVPALGTIFLAITTLLLVTDLKRPERFLYILQRPNWKSWLVKGSYILMAYGAFLGLWLVLGLAGVAPPAAFSGLLAWLTGVSAMLAAVYTAWLFQQAKGRVLWMRRGLTLQLGVHALIAGHGFLLALLTALGLVGSEPLVGVSLTEIWLLNRGLIGALALHLILTGLERFLAPPGRNEEYQRVLALIEQGPFSSRHWLHGLGLGVLAPVVLLTLVPHPAAWMLAGALALYGLWTEEDIFVRAGQALPIS